MIQKAAPACFVVVFDAAFMLGALRVAVIAPGIGALAAYAAGLTPAPGAGGLAGQIGFAVIPICRPQTSG